MCDKPATRVSERTLNTTHANDFTKADPVEEAYDLFANQRDGALKVAITP